MRSDNRGLRRSLPQSLGVFALAYGTPSGPEDLEAFYTDIRRGRPPSAELLAELRARYAAIGGRSPLMEITGAQARGLARLLSEDAAVPVPVAVGMKHSAPSIEDGVGELVARGAGRIVAVVLAPHYSRMSVGEYAERALAAAAVAPGPCELTVVRSWHLAPGYLDFLAGAVQDAVAELPPDARHGAHVVFTAHSLPTRILDDGDPYRAQLAETATSVAQRLGLHRWSIAWQSAGRTADPWIGPDILQVIDELRAGDASAVVVCAAGFVSDHLEVLYDLDVEARARARQQGLAFARTRSPNDDPVFVRALADVVHEHLAAVPA